MTLLWVAVRSSHGYCLAEWIKLSPPLVPCLAQGPGCTSQKYWQRPVSDNPSERHPVERQNWVNSAFTFSCCNFNLLLE